MGVSRGSTFLGGVLAGAVACVVVFALSLARRVPPPPPLAPPWLPGNPFPLDLTVVGPDGAPTTLRALAAGRPLVLHVGWMVSDSALRELGGLAALARALGDVVAVVAVVDPGDLDEVGDRRGEFGLGDFPVHRLVGDVPAGFAAPLGARTFLLDRDARLVLAHPDGADWSHPSVVERLRGLARGEA